MTGISLPTVILHISDVHFGADSDLAARDGRAAALAGLIRRLRGLDPDWKPDFVALTGDVGWAGRESDYVLAASWLRDLLAALGLGPERLIMCPGNHDVARSVAAKIPRASDASEADQVLSPPLPEYLFSPFQEYSKFCQKFGVLPFDFSGAKNYVHGTRDEGAIRFVSLNSSWFSRGKDDRNRLWLGLPLLKHLQENKKLMHPSERLDSPITVALVHHPDEWLAEAEMYGYGGRPGTLDFLAKRVDLILSGHTHGEPKAASVLAESAYTMRCGATYAGSDYRNNCRLIRVSTTQIEYRMFEFNPSSPEESWIEFDRTPRLPLRRAEPSPAVEIESAQIDVAEMRRRAEAHAGAYVAQKLRALKPNGTLPTPTPSYVWPSTPTAGPVSEKETTLRGSRLPFPDAARGQKRVLLLGDLGSGKSHIIGDYGAALNVGSDGVLAILVEARTLQMRREDSPRVALTAIANAAREHVFHNLKYFDLEAVIRDTPVVILVDGLDEIDASRAADLLFHLGRLVAIWPMLRCVATGRPVELKGLSYADWMCWTPLPLSSVERKTLFASEARANGVAENELNGRVSAVERRILVSPFLQVTASTPLGARLLYYGIDGARDADSTTLGDLFFTVVVQRLGHWTALDRKVSTSPAFEKALPDAIGRGALFGSLALAALRGPLRETGHHSVERERAKDILRSGLVTAVGGATESLLTEGLEFLQSSGLVVIDETSVRFPNHAFFQFVCGWGLAFEWRSKDALKQQQDGWRVVAFAATVARRSGFLSEIQSRLAGYIEQLLSTPPAHAGAAYVVAESGSASLGVAYLERLKLLGTRPLTVFQDARGESEDQIATALDLAGDDGFCWLFDEYFDPRYPLVHAGSALPAAVLSAWAKRRRGTELSEPVARRLRSLLLPHLEVSGPLLIPVVPIFAFLMPESLSELDRLWFWAKHLRFGADDEVNAERSLRQACSEGKAALVERILFSHAAIDYENGSRNAALWLEISNERPPIEIVRAVVGAREHSWASTLVEGLVERCRERLGLRAWNRTLRWLLSDRDARVSARAAIHLYDEGERSLLLLAPPLLGGMHEGGYIRDAERVLHKLVAENGPSGLEWITARIFETGEYDRAFAGWWRIFLSQLSVAEPDAGAFLVSCMHAVSGSLLSRHADVRLAFQSALRDPSRGAVLRSGLRKCLRSADPEQRHGAAMVLLIADQDRDGEELDVVVRATAHFRVGPAWHEWEQTVLGLEIGFGPIALVKSRLESYFGRAEAFALLLLFKNRALEGPAKERLLAALVREGREWWLQDPERSQLFGESTALAMLLPILHSGTYAESSEAARQLAIHHLPSLSGDDAALCDLLQFENGFFGWRAAKLVNSLAGLDHGQHIASRAKIFEERFGHRPLLDIFREALANPPLWIELLEKLLFSHRRIGLGRPEETGQWALDFGRAHPEYRSAIGQAAASLRERPRDQKRVHEDGRLWTALLCDEFLGHDPAAIELVLSASKGSHSNVVPALVARLGRRPDRFVGRPAIGGVSLQMPEPSILDDTRLGASLVERLDEMKKGLNASIIVESFISQDLELDAEMMALLGNHKPHGPILSGVLRLLDGLVADHREILVYQETFGVGRSQPGEPWTRLWNMWTNHVYPLAVKDDSVRKQLVPALSAAVMREPASWGLAAALLRLEPSAGEAVLPVVVRSYAEGAQFEEFELAAALARHAKRAHTKSALAPLAEVARKAIEILHELSILRDKNPKDPFRFLFFPLVIWLHTGNASTREIAVFARGIRMLLDQSSSKLGPPDVLGLLFPLLESIEPALLQGVATQATAFGDTSVLGLCALLGLRPGTGRG